MKSKIITATLFTCVIMNLSACDSDTAPTASTTKKDSTNPNNTVKSSCKLADSLPIWSGKIAVVWQESPGGGCVTSPVKASVTELNSYSILLGNSNWTSSTGWITAGTLSSVTYKKNINVDTAYELGMNGSSLDSQYTFTLQSKLITYASPIERMFHILPIPKWQGETLKWTFSSYTSTVGSTNSITTSSSELAKYNDSLISNGWAKTTYPSQGIIDYAIVYNGDKYTLQIRIDNWGQCDFILFANVP
jgi:hypothetical protein